MHHWFIYITMNVFAPFCAHLVSPWVFFIHYTWGFGCYFVGNQFLFRCCQFFRVHIQFYFLCFGSSLTCYWLFVVHIHFFIVFFCFPFGVFPTIFCAYLVSLFTHYGFSLVRFWLFLCAFWFWFKCFHKVACLLGLCASLGLHQKKWPTTFHTQHIWCGIWNLLHASCNY